MMRRPPAVEVIILLAGLVASIASGIYGYRVVGLYGDGAFANGFHRETDPQTGQSVLVHEVTTSKGRIRRVVDNRLRVREVGMDADGDGVLEARVTAPEGAAARSSRTEIDQNRNGRVDTWGYWDAGRLTRIEIDLDENGQVERWEHYGAAAQLEKVGSSSRNDGVEDTWSYPDSAGLVIKEEFDTDRDGRIDRRNLYVAPQGSPSTRVLSVVEVGIDASGRPERRLHYRADGSFDRVERLSRSSSP